MKKEEIVAVCLFGIVLVGVCSAGALELTHDSKLEPNAFALNRLRQVLDENPPSGALKLSLSCANNPDPDCDDGYSLRRDNDAFTIGAQNDRGLMYGVLELAAQLKQGRDLASIQEKVYEIIERKLSVNPEQITPEASFTEDLGADSLDTVELVMDLEEQFNLTIPEEDQEKLRTVQDAIDYLDSHLD